MLEQPAITSPSTDRTAITVACLPDDIEQFLCVGQYARAIEALARRRNITADEAGAVLHRLTPE